MLNAFFFVAYILAGFVVMTNNAECYGREELLPGDVLTGLLWPVLVANAAYGKIDCPALIGRQSDG